MTCDTKKEGPLQDHEFWLDNIGSWSTTRPSGFLGVVHAELHDPFLVHKTHRSFGSSCAPSQLTYSLSPGAFLKTKSVCFSSREDPTFGVLLPLWAGIGEKLLCLIKGVDLALVCGSMRSRTCFCTLPEAGNVQDCSFLFGEILGYACLFPDSSGLLRVRAHVTRTSLPQCFSGRIYLLLFLNYSLLEDSFSFYGPLFTGFPEPRRRHFFAFRSCHYY